MRSDGGDLEYGLPGFQSLLACLRVEIGNFAHLPNTRYVIYVYVCVRVYMYIYIYTHTHTHTQGYSK